MLNIVNLALIEGFAPILDLLTTSALITFQSFDVKVDEASLTGEAELVKKQTDRDVMLLAGTQVRITFIIENIVSPGSQCDTGQMLE